MLAFTVAVDYLSTTKKEQDVLTFNHKAFLKAFFVDRDFYFSILVTRTFTGVNFYKEVNMIEIPTGLLWCLIVGLVLIFTATLLFAWKLWVAGGVKTQGVEIVRIFFTAFCDKENGQEMVIIYKLKGGETRAISGYSNGDHWLKCRYQTTSSGNLCRIGTTKWSREDFKAILEGAKISFYNDYGNFQFEIERR
ncbi:hypothetical protein KKC60_01180 [Patescibacteria group bacterium]|nr:hypothetical protein [Patescibacteria group bacterium]